MRGSILVIALVGSLLLASLPALADGPDASACVAAATAGPAAKAQALADAATRVVSQRTAESLRIVAVFVLDPGGAVASDLARAETGAISDDTVNTLLRGGSQAPALLGQGLQAGAPALLVTASGAVPVLLTAVAGESAALPAYAGDRVVALGLGSVGARLDAWTLDPPAGLAWVQDYAGKPLPVAPATGAALQLAGGVTSSAPALLLVLGPVGSTSLDLQPWLDPLGIALRGVDGMSGGLQDPAMVLVGHAIGDGLTVAGLGTQAEKASLAALQALPSQVPGCVHGA